ncbi:DUF2585 family protein [Roseimaritima ulvae]|uniref:DUF2585 family protein n=1 Tax=Roseimaritima ulvae TaxID=980254 RepID=A0A5B9R251_9BACT|nr:DUF2585 family protein [Roseimaritima ulvae]QEG43516.1 hypothetical protein UC8_55670 [Roseimaritima ulvae]
MQDPPTQPYQATRRDALQPALVLFAIAAVMTACLWAMGRVWWCEVGDVVPWSWDVWSPHNSQHLIDPYSLSHLEHGLALFLMLHLVAKRWLTQRQMIYIVAIVEAVWEIAENTPWMIERYRTATISLDYFGDSILNSLGDLVMCLIGVQIARKSSWWITVGLLVTLELVSVLWIRDSLLLNILMLTAPSDAIRTWQAGD